MKVAILKAVNHHFIPNTPQLCGEVHLKFGMEEYLEGDYPQKRHSYAVSD